MERAWNSLEWTWNMLGTGLEQAWNRLGTGWNKLGTGLKQLGTGWELACLGQAWNSLEHYGDFVQQSYSRVRHYGDFCATV